MMPLENKQEFRSVGAWNVSFCSQIACRLQVAKGTKEPLAGPRDFRRSGHFL